jgi:VanZ family protein
MPTEPRTFMKPESHIAQHWRWISRVLFVLGVGVLIWLSLAPPRGLPPISVWDKLNHFLAYGTVATFGLGGYTGRRALRVVVPGLILLGVILEVLQYFVPGRDASVLDMLANALGCLAAAVAVSAAHRLLSGGSAPANEAQHEGGQTGSEQ